MGAQDTSFHRKTTLNCGGRIIDLSTPIVMGILNVTPDSFHDGGKFSTVDSAVAQALSMQAEGAKIIDIGGASSRPNADQVSIEVEIDRCIPVIEALISEAPDLLISIDTFNSEVARAAINAGATLVNDISAGTIDKDMLACVAELKVPYIAMHMGGTPQTMQEAPQYDNVVFEVTAYLSDRIAEMKSAGIHDIILDPGFGFGKTVEHNFQLLEHLDHFGKLGMLLLVGISRKSMIQKTLFVTADEALNGTSALHMTALERGAHILRVHDVKEAVQCVQLFSALNKNKVTSSI